MTDYERKAINGYVEPVLMVLALGATYEALELPPREEEEQKLREEHQNNS